MYFPKHMKNIALLTLHLEEPIFLLLFPFFFLLKVYLTWEGVLHMEVPAAIYMGSRRGECG